MDATDREPTRKMRQPQARSQARPQPRPQPPVSDRATVVVNRLPATRPPATRSAALRAPESRSPAESAEAADVTLIAPKRAIAPTAPRLAPAGRPTLSRMTRFIAVLICVAGVLGSALAYNVVHNNASSSASVASAVPPPSGRGPITASVGVIVAVPAPQSVHSSQTVLPYQSQVAYTSAGNEITAKGLLSLEPCHDSVMFVPNISQWTVPPGCYANIYVPNPANYVQAASWGYCNWWVEVTHPNAPDITYNGYYPRGTTPVAGAAIYFDGGEQGADPAGHWAETVAVSPDGYWILISEMNFAWRGGGWGKIDYRYVHLSPHVHFLYGV